MNKVLEKLGYKLTQKRREGLKSKQFAVPVSKAKKIGVAGEVKGKAKGKYPIHDISHARNALARVSQFGTPAEKAAVRAKVKARYPQIKSKTAGMSFLKQDRPDKVKDIYKALKRDHPDMPAEMKARIAARQGKPGKQKQGPPYKGPLTKKSSLFTEEKKASIMEKSASVSGKVLKFLSAGKRIPKGNYTKGEKALGLGIVAGTPLMGASMYAEHKNRPLWA